MFLFPKTSLRLKGGIWRSPPPEVLQAMFPGFLTCCSVLSRTLDPCAADTVRHRQDLLELLLPLKLRTLLPRGGAWDPPVVLEDAKWEPYQHTDMSCVKQSLTGHGGTGHSVCGSPPAHACRCAASLDACSF